MAAVEERQLLYSMDSMRAIETVKRWLGESLDELAVKRVRSAGRDLVTADDVLNSVTEALRGLAEKISTADDES